MDIDPTGKRDNALLGVLKTILLFLESLQLRSTCNILQVECAQMGYPELDRSQPHILVLRPSETFSSTPITNPNNNNHTSKGGKSVPFCCKTVERSDVVNHPLASGSDLIYGPESNAGDMPYVHHTHHSKKEKDEQRNKRGKNLGIAINGNEIRKMDVKEMLSQAEGVMKELQLHGKFGEGLERHSVTVFFADTQQQDPQISTHQNHNPPPQQHFQNDNLNARALCSCCSCREYAATAALATTATESRSGENNLRSRTSSGGSFGCTMYNSGGICMTTSGNYYAYCPSSLVNVCSNISSCYPRPACLYTHPNICARNLSAGELSEEHIKLLAIASNLTHALQSQVRGQSNRIDELLETCRRLCPEFFAPCKGACAGKQEPEEVPSFRDAVQDTEQDHISVKSEEKKSATIVVTVEPEVKVERIPKGKKVGHKKSDCLIKAEEIMNKRRIASESSFNSLENYGTELDFKKIKRHLITKSADVKMELLQALRWRLTKSDDESRDHSLNSYIRNDLLGLNTADATAFLTKFLGDNNSEKPELMQETMARLVNAFASLTLGRDYLSFDDNVVMDLLIPLLLSEHSSGVILNQKTHEFLIATLQKLSLRSKIRKIMVSKGVVEYIFDYLSANLNEMNSYGLEYATALLMNLCLQPEAQKICSTRSTQAVEVMQALLKSEYPCCLLYTNGIMYSLLKDRNINAEAHNMNLEDDINAAMENYADNTELKRQFEVILALHRQGADPELEHACATAEPDEELDIIEPELDMDDVIDGSDDILRKYRIKLDSQTGNITLTTLCNPTTPRSARSAFRPNSTDSNTSRSANTKDTREERDQFNNDSDQDRDNPYQVSDVNIVQAAGTSQNRRASLEIPPQEQQQRRQSNASRSDSNENRLNRNVYKSAEDQRVNNPGDRTPPVNGETGKRKLSRTRSGSGNNALNGKNSSELGINPISQSSRVNSSNTNPSTIPSKPSSKSDWSRSSNNPSNISKTPDTASIQSNKSAEPSNCSERSTATTISNVVKDAVNRITDVPRKNPVENHGSTPATTIKVVKKPIDNYGSTPAMTTKVVKNPVENHGSTPAMTTKVVKNPVENHGSTPAMIIKVVKNPVENHGSTPAMIIKAVKNPIDNYGSTPAMTTKVVKNPVENHGSTPAMIIKAVKNPVENHGSTPTPINKVAKNPVENHGSTPTPINKVAKNPVENHGSTPVPTTKVVKNPVENHGSIVPAPTTKFVKNPVENHGSIPTPTTKVVKNPIDNYGSTPAMTTKVVKNPVENHGSTPVPTTKVVKNTVENHGSTPVPTTKVVKKPIDNYGSTPSMTIKAVKNPVENHGSIVPAPTTKVVKKPVDIYDSTPATTSKVEEDLRNRVTDVAGQEPVDNRESTMTTTSNVVKDVVDKITDVPQQNVIRPVSAPSSFRATEDTGSRKMIVAKPSRQSNKDGMGVIIAVDKGVVYDQISGPSKYSNIGSECTAMGRATDEQLEKIRYSLRQGLNLEEAMEAAAIRSMRSGISTDDSKTTICCGHERMVAENVCHQECIVIKEQRKSNIPQTGCADNIDIATYYSEQSQQGTQSEPQEQKPAVRQMPKHKHRAKPRANLDDSDKYGRALNYGCLYPDPLEKCRMPHMAKCERKCEVARKRFCARANQQCVAHAPDRPAWCCSIRPPTSQCAKIQTVTRPAPPLLQGYCKSDGRQLNYETRCGADALLKQRTCDCYQEIRNFLSQHNACRFLPNQNRSTCGVTKEYHGQKRCCRDRSQ